MSLNAGSSVVEQGPLNSQVEGSIPFPRSIFSGHN